MSDFSDTANAALLEHAGTFYPQTLVFQFESESALTVRCRVKDSRKPEVRNLLESLGIGAEYLKDARLMHIHPGDPLPPEGARADFDGGTLVLTTYEQTHPHHNQRSAACTFSR